MHPQLAATLLGCPLPAQPGESGEPPRVSNRPAQRVCVEPVNALRYYVREQVEHGALTAVAGRMFRR